MLSKIDSMPCLFPPSWESSQRIGKCLNRAAPRGGRGLKWKAPEAAAGPVRMRDDHKEIVVAVRRLLAPCPRIERVFACPVKPCSSGASKITQGPNWSPSWEAAYCRRLRHSIG